MSTIDTDKFKKGEELPLIEEFYSIQGEGYNMGKPAYFIRVGGCDIGCKWCDSKVSWDPDFHNITYVKDIVTNANKYPAKAVVVTGGEPLAQKNCLVLLDELVKNYKVSLETSGSIDINPVNDKVDIVMDIKTPASGEVDKNLWDNLKHLKKGNYISKFTKLLIILSP